jgi:perosamine synthetase
MHMDIPLSSPDISEKEIEAVTAVLRSRSLSLGPKLRAFEEEFASYIGCKHAIAVNSGTSGLHLAVRSLGIGGGDAVITTPFSFVASANCLLYEGAVPIFVDIEPKTFNMDPERIRSFLEEECRREGPHGFPVEKSSGRVIKGILPVHVFGHPCEMNPIEKLAREFNLFVLEDACEAIGAEYLGKRAGSFGDLAVFAFYPNKQITTGEGGMIVTDSDELASRCRSLRNQGREGEEGWLAHRRLGFNYRLSDMNCALGLEQLRRIDEILEKRSRVASRYDELLRPCLQLPDTLPGVRKSWFVYVACLPESFTSLERDFTVMQLRASGIGSNNYFPPIHLQPFYRETFGFKEGDFRTCEGISRRSIALPFFNHLTGDEISWVVEKLLNILSQVEGHPDPAIWEWAGRLQSEESV